MLWSRRGFNPKIQSQLEGSERVVIFVGISIKSPSKSTGIIAKVLLRIVNEALNDFIESAYFRKHTISLCETNPETLKIRMYTSVRLSNTFNQLRILMHCDDLRIILTLLQYVVV